MTVTLSERIVDANGEQIFLTEAGRGKPVVLLHGGGPGASGMSNFSRNVEALAEHFRVIVPDLPGYGRSSKGVDGSHPFGYLADGTRGMLDALEIPKASLVGNSYGGACALRLALDTPGRVDRLVLMGPGGVGVTRRPPTKGLNDLLNYYGGEGPTREKLATFIRQYLVFDGSAVPDAVIDERYQSSIDPEVVANPPLRRPSGLMALRTLWRMDFTRDSRLPSLEVPTLVVWGKEDKVNRLSGGAALAKAIPNCRLLEVASAGHWVQWEQADLFNQVVTEYLLAAR